MFLRFEIEKTLLMPEEKCCLVTAALRSKEARQPQPQKMHTNTKLTQNNSNTKNSRTKKGGGGGRKVE